MGMNFLVLLIPIWVLSSILVSSATTTPPLPSNSDPVLPAEKDPSSQISADREAKPPGVAEVRIVHHQDLNKKILVALIVSSSLLGGVVLALTWLWVCRYRSLKKSAVNSQTKQDAAKVQSRAPTSGKFQSSKSAGRKGNVAVIDYQLLVAATNNFLESNILTEGGFGRVYKASFNDNLLGAVKRNHGGPDAELEFENEMEWLSKIHHQNIVSLLGYCIHGETRFLVYEMMQNGSLESQLHGLSRGSALTWQIRMKIALDVARGLEFLHERCNPQVIHRDLKTSNILLDSNFNAKLSDFGLAITGGNQGKDNLKLSGTLGYVAPEYLLDGKLTDKSDVYAFGVVLLELLTGRKPVEKTATSHQSLVTWAMPQLTDRSKLPKIVDPVIRDTMDLKHLYQVAAVAVLCVQPEPSYRPLITDVLHSFVPLVPPELRGSLRITEPVKVVRR